MMINCLSRHSGLVIAAFVGLGSLVATTHSLKAQQVDQPWASSAVSDVLRHRATDRWEKEIVALEKLDAVDSDPENAILLIGSSSIRLWKTSVEDLSPYPIIRRGYGGAKYSDLAVFAERLIQPHRYRAILMFVANDVSGKDDDASVEEIRGWVQHILEVAHRHAPTAPVFIIEITPTESRWQVWPEIRSVNAMLREIALVTPNTYLIPTAEHFLTADGMPRADLFQEDKLHLNRSGYLLWGKILKWQLDAHLQ